MSKIYDALTRSLLEHYPADWLTQLGNRWCPDSEPGDGWPGHIHLAQP